MTALSALAQRDDVGSWYALSVPDGSDGTKGLVSRRHWKHLLKSQRSGGHEQGDCDLRLL